LSLFAHAKLREAIEIAARENDHSLSAEIRCAIRAHVSAPPDARPTAPGSASGGKEESTS
jgi:hypothetical protein